MLRKYWKVATRRRRDDVARSGRLGGGRTPRGGELRVRLSRVSVFEFALVLLALVMLRLLWHCWRERPRGTG